MNIEKALYCPPEQITDFIAAVKRWPREKAQLWMQCFFNPETMIVLTDEDEKIEIVVQFTEITFIMQNQHYKGYFLHPFYFEQATSTQELNQFLSDMEEMAKRQALVLLTDSPELQKRLDLEEIDYLLTGFFDFSTPIPGNPKLCEPYRENDYLYPIYSQFMSNFDGSILLDQEEFSNWLDYSKNSGYQILVSRTRSGLPNGFAIISSQQEKVTLLVAVYSDIEALLNMLSHLQEYYDEIEIAVSEAESLDQLFPIKLEKVVNLYGKLLHPDLAQKLDLPGESLEEILENLEENHWNNLLV